MYVYIHYVSLLFRVYWCECVLKTNLNANVGLETNLNDEFKYGKCDEFKCDEFKCDEFKCDEFKCDEFKYGKVKFIPVAYISTGAFSVYIHTYVSACMHTYKCLYTYRFTQTYIHTCIHTYIRI